MGRVYPVIVRIVPQYVSVPQRVKASNSKGAEPATEKG